MQLIFRNYLTDLSELREWFETAYQLRVNRFENVKLIWWGANSTIRKSLDSKETVPLLLHPKITETKQKLAQQFQLHYESAGDVFFYSPETFLIKKHSHDLVKNHCEIRFNIMVQKPLGGEPIVENRIYDVNEGDLLIFDANLPHWTNTVTGKSRMLMSFGWYVPTAKANELCPTHQMNPQQRATIYSVAGLSCSTIEAIDHDYNEQMRNALMDENALKFGKSPNRKLM